MGICTTLIIMDEFDWGYSGYSKEKALKHVAKEYRVVAHWYTVIVIDIDKGRIYEKEELPITCDALYEIQDINSLLIKRVE